jgi:hypothetical protein
MGLAGLGALQFAGPVGLAAAAIGLIGSFFGGKKGNTVVHADQAEQRFNVANSAITDRWDGPTGYYGATPLKAFGDLPAMIQGTIDALKSLGGTNIGFSAQAVYDSLSTPTPELRSSVGTFSLGNQEAGMTGFLKALIGVTDGIDAVLKTTAAHSSATTLKDLAGDLDFAKTLSDSVAAIGDLGQALDAVTAKAKATAVSMVASFDETQTRAEALGIGDLSKDAIAKQIRAWMGQQGPQATPSATQQALAQIAGAFAGLGEAGAKYGISQTEVDAAQASAIQKVRDQFNATLDQILDPTSAALASFDKAADQMRQDALDLGADMVKTEQAIARQRQQILDQQLSGVASSVRAFLDGQSLDATSSLSPQGRLAAAQDQFAAALEGTRAGDGYQSSRLVAAAQALLGEGRAVYGSTADYVALESFTRASLSNLGSQQGWDGFPAAIQTQTSALINAQQIGFSAVVDELRKTQDRLAAIENRLFLAQVRAA